MKRNSLSTNLKDYTTCNATKESSYANYHNKNQMVKEFLDCNNSHSNNNNNNNNNGEDYMNGFPWPPRSYTCSFCRKEFKSAQALGGHMNVHRRDRARLRQSPPSPTDHGHGQGLPMLNLNLNPTTTTNPNLSSTSTLSLLPSSWSSHSSSLKPAVTCTLPLFVSPSTTPPPPPPSSDPSSNASASELKRSWVVVDGILLKNPLSRKTSEPTKSKIAESLGGIGEDHGCKMLTKCEILRMDLEIGLPREYDLDLELRLGNYT